MDILFRSADGQRRMILDPSDFRFVSFYNRLIKSLIVFIRHIDVLNNFSKIFKHSLDSNKGISNET